MFVMDLTAYARKRLAATANRRRGVCNRACEPGVRFAEEEAQGSGRMICLKKTNRIKANFAPTCCRWRYRILLEGKESIKCPHQQIGICLPQFFLALATFSIMDRYYPLTF